LFGNQLNPRCGKFIWSGRAEGGSNPRGKGADLRPAAAESRSERDHAEENAAAEGKRGRKRRKGMTWGPGWSVKDAVPEKLDLEA